VELEATIIMLKHPLVLLALVVAARVGIQEMVD
jgi:hypothetical protein